MTTKWTKKAVQARVRHVFRRDKAEGAIVAALERAGWVVVPVNSKGVADLLCAKEGRLVPLEVKGYVGGKGQRSSRGTLEPAQARVHLRLRTAGVVVPLVSTPEEALAAVEGRAVRDASSVPGGKHLAPLFAAADREAERRKQGLATAHRALVDRLSALVEKMPGMRVRLPLIPGEIVQARTEAGAFARQRPLVLPLQQADLPRRVSYPHDCYFGCPGTLPECAQLAREVKREEEEGRKRLLEREDEA